MFLQIKGRKNEKKTEMIKRVKLIVLIAVVSLILLSCNRNRVYQKYVEIPNNVWNVENIIEFDFEIEDTITRYNMFLHVRHSGHYPFKNIWLFTTTTAPNGYNSIDTVEIILCDDSGKWHGDGLGDIWDNKIPFKKNVIFPMAGSYKLNVEQAMRFEKLPGVMDIGLSVEKKPVEN